MIEEKYKIVEANSDLEWDNFLLKTENQNIYSSSEFINNNLIPSKKYFIKKKDEIFASFHLFIKEKIIVTGERIYSPLNYKFFEKQNQSSIKYKKFEIVNIYANYIKDNFKSGDICLDFNTNDLRAFYWINFDEKKEIFSTKIVRYTSTLNIKNSANFKKYSDITSDILYKNFSRSLKQQITKSIDENFLFKEEFDPIFFEKTVKSTFKNQGKNPDLNFDKIKPIYDQLFNKKKLVMFISLKNETKLSFCIFGIIGNNAVYLNGGRVENTNDDSSLTYNLTMSLSALKKKGVVTVDLEGVNSPKRGFWKLGFGGDIRPYYHLLFKS